MKLLDCGHGYEEAGKYGTDNHGKKHCYKCCADQDREYMDKNGKITLYYTDRTVKDFSIMGSGFQNGGSHGKVTNWPNSLSYDCHYSKSGKHNWAGVRIDFWFSDHKGDKWWGYQLGHYNEIAHCKRIKNDT